MNCPRADWTQDKEFFRGLFRRAEEARVPLAGTLELTRRCRMRCVHCYLGDHERPDGQREMSTEQVLDIMRQLANAGCLAMIITGGDPLLRSDFGQVYRTAKLSGIDVSVYTSGTDVTDEVVELFQDLPPRVVEITIHGSTAETFERISGVKGSFRRVWEGIHRLHDGGVRLGLKTMLMTLNHHELGAMAGMAEGIGAEFRFDPLVNARLDGDREPLQLRVDAAEVVQTEFEDPELRLNWLRLYRSRPTLVDPKKVLQCGAGQTQFHIDAYGRLQPCLMLPGVFSDLTTDSLASAWDRIGWIREMNLGQDSHCASCDKRVYCGYCPGLLGLESGGQWVPSEYLCALGDKRTMTMAALSREEA